MSMEAGVILTAQFFKEPIQCLKTTDDYLLIVSIKSQSDSVSLRLDDLKVSRQTREYKSHGDRHRARVRAKADALRTADSFFCLFVSERRLTCIRLPFLKRDFKLEICSCFRTHA